MRIGRPEVRQATPGDAPAGASSRPAPLVVAATGWIRGPLWDLAWILNALWLAPLLLCLAHGADDIRHGAVDTLFFAAAVPLWFGDRVSSAWLAYATPAYRPLLASIAAAVASHERRRSETAGPRCIVAQRAARDAGSKRWITGCSCRSCRSCSCRSASSSSGGCSRS